MRGKLRFSLISVLQRYDARAPWCMMHVGQGVWRTVVAYRRCQATGWLPAATSQPVWTHLLRAVSVLEAQFCITDSVYRPKHAASVSTNMDTCTR